MTVTLTDTEALEYLEYLEKKKSFIETKAFIDRLIDIREELKPHVFRLSLTPEDSILTWEYTVKEVNDRAERLNELLTKTLNGLTAYNAEHRKEKE